MMQNGEKGNEFAEMEYMNITVVTSNEPFGISDGSNPLFDGLRVPKFELLRGGVHSGHVQTGVWDPFCIVKNGKGRCKVVCWDLNPKFEYIELSISCCWSSRVLILVVESCRMDTQLPLMVRRQFVFW